MNPTDTLCVFDDYVFGPIPVYSSLEHSEALGRSDQLGIHAVVTEPSGYELQLSVRIESSRDGAQDDVGPHVRGSRWQPLATAPELAGPIKLPTTSLYGGESWPARPRHRYVRLRIQLVAGLIKEEVARDFAFARVAVYVTARTRTRGSGVKSPPPAVRAERAAVAELQRLVADVPGLPPEAQRDHVLSRATPATIAQLHKGAAALAAMKSTELVRLRRNAEAALAMLKDVACEPCANGELCAPCDETH